MVAYSLDNVTSLGSVTDERVSKDANLFILSIPRSDSSNAAVIDLFGATMVITVTGTFSTANGTIATFISQIEGLITGTQPTRDFVSGVSGNTIKVKVETVEWTQSETTPQHVNYTLTLHQQRTDLD